jgi:hypothetical protein
MVACCEGGDGGFCGWPDGKNPAVPIQIVGIRPQPPAHCKTNQRLELTKCLRHEGYSQFRDESCSPTLVKEGWKNVRAQTQNTRPK